MPILKLRNTKRLILECYTRFYLMLSMLRSLLKRNAHPYYFGGIKTKTLFGTEHDDGIDERENTAESPFHIVIARLVQHLVLVFQFPLINSVN